MKALLSRAGIGLCVLLFAANALAQMSAKPTPVDTVIKNGTILTVTHGTIENGSIVIRNGKIAEVGKTVSAPANARVIDATGKFVMPGIIDAHSHTALSGDVNELTNVIGPHMMMLDAFDYTDKNIYHALAGGTTTSMLLHGSGNMIGGQSAVIKHKFGLDRDDLLFPDAPRSIKFASGENPKRVYGTRNQ
ncbi:MAG: amidohydrolase, partial [Terriglobales bacterium]